MAPHLCYDWLMTNDVEREMYDNMIRNLVAIGDTVGRSAIDLVLDFDALRLSGPLMIQVRDTISAGNGGRPVTDSTIEDLIEAMSDDDDNWNE